jgi:serine/threonine protein phosphatase PrpC
MTLVLRYAARSDRGLVRSNNQDSVYAGPRLLALADGMGGHAAGEVASKVVIAALAPLDDDEPSDDLLGQLREATVAGNGAIAELVAGDPDLDGMGTTLSAILFAGSRIGLVHIGDSRAYLRRNGQFSQITHDDTFVQSLIDEGRITEDEAATHPQRSLLLKALTGHDIEPSLTVREARPGDRYLLCSDGLSGVVTDETLAEAIQIPDPQSCADRMIELALKGGGPDNVTVIIADVMDVDFGEDVPIVGGAAGDGSNEPPPPDSAASRAGALTAPRPEPKRVEHEERPDPAVKRRKRIRLAVILLVVLVLLAAGAVVVRYWVLRQYFVGETGNGEIVVYQGVRGSVLGLPLQRQVEGSCDPAPAVCTKLYIDDLNQTGRQTVKDGGTYYDKVEDAKSFVDTLRRENRFTLSCAELSAQQSATPTTSSKAKPTTTTKAAGQPGGGATQGPTAPRTTTTTATPTTATPPPGNQAPQPGVNCRPPHDGDGGG